MKRFYLTALFVSVFIGKKAAAQDLNYNEVPSVIINSFNKTFPKAFDAEWELDGGYYKAEFEIGVFGTDHDIWYDKKGRLIKHTEEISKNELPKNILKMINSGFIGFRIDDVKRITEYGKTTYTMELKSFTEEWKAAFDHNGNLLSKVAD
ncbi:Putative beta-lactamase-inhibitor-like, PepSY-like [Paenimyroides ummariense]|uniref:Putative beta-lactamase-inhibitor-like, PepSY-like n=1 Tax=Paenimyroides ummariense TaxID=913024 RepID=A0A1I5DT44_9FLAO|nr:PepSY-like domain-containing protein [Paenimyroides ummariense]SFO01941.1 Putative beta-lactamase-inhibitor-like, PepSY-like [Paenimyroides ummariense]